jgi:hypothetical protein
MHRRQWRSDSLPAGFPPLPGLHIAAIALVCKEMLQSCMYCQGSPKCSVRCMGKGRRKLWVEDLRGGMEKRAQQLTV